MKYCLWILLIGLCPIVSSVGVDIDYSVDRTNWVDIHDPLAKPTSIANPNTKENVCVEDCEEEITRYTEENNKLRESINVLRTTRENSVDVLLKHVLREFLSKLNVDLNSESDIYKIAQVTIPQENLRLIRRYLSSAKASEEFGLREDVRSALEDFVVEIEQRAENYIFSLVRFVFPYIVLINVAILPLAFLVVVRSIFSIRQLLLVVLIAAFFTSCYFTYARKYQEVLAERFERLEKKSDSHCTPKGLLSEAYDVLLSYVKIKGKSECLQSHEDVLIEPFLLVDPMIVVAEVLTNFVFSPLSVIGVHFNKFFSDFFINTPIHLAILKAVFLIFLMFYLTGYRIRTLIATIEPADNRWRIVPEIPFLDHNILHPHQGSGTSNRIDQHSCEALPAPHTDSSLSPSRNSDFNDSHTLEDLDDSNVTIRRHNSRKRSQSAGRMKIS
ncbi:hypothetical protein Ddc_03136 [Ditylenchus destructor]|nr:hypothetical protein Ddc_03136 [Ditylenchus destructor]